MKVCTLCGLKRETEELHAIFFFQGNSGEIEIAECNGTWLDVIE